MGYAVLLRSPIDFSRKWSVNTTSVGIFFGVMFNGFPTILHDATPVAEAEDYDLCKTHPRGHLAVWEASRAALSLQDEYDDYPRGRIVFDTSLQLFIVYLDRSLDVPEFRRAVTHYFALPDGGTVFRHDAHYSRARHKMKMGSE